MRVDLTTSHDARAPGSTATAEAAIPPAGEAPAGEHGHPHPADTETKIAVYTAHGCAASGCTACADWTQHLNACGFQPRVFDLQPDQLVTLRRRLGVPDAMASCHTAVVGPYVVEGHVPAAALRRLLACAWDVVGIAAPGRPAKANGQTVSAQRGDLFLLKPDGRTERVSDD